MNFKPLMSDMGEPNYGEQGQCEAQSKRTGERCKAHAINGTGKCYHHGGKLAVRDGGEPRGAPDPGENSETHGLHSDREKWWDRHYDEVKDSVQERLNSWMEDAPFGWDRTGKVETLLELAIDEERIQQGGEYIDERGMVVKKKQVAGEGFVKVDVANPAIRPKDRMRRTTNKVLKDMGILDSPEMKQAETKEDIAQAWRDALKGRGIEDDEEDSQED